MFWLLYYLTNIIASCHINTNRNYDYDIFNQQINIHLDISHKVIGIKRCHHGMSV
jgi:hypothetical protein